MWKALIIFPSSFSKNEIKSSVVNKFVSYRNKTHSFGHLNEMIDRLELVSKIKDQDSFYNNCTIIPRQVNEFTESLAHRMDITIDKYCRFLFLKNLRKFSSNISA